MLTGGWRKLDCAEFYESGGCSGEGGRDVEVASGHDRGGLRSL